MTTRLVVVTGDEKGIICNPGELEISLAERIESLPGFLTSMYTAAEELLAGGSYMRLVTVTLL